MKRSLNDFKTSPQSTENTLRTPSPSLSKAGTRKLSTSGEKANKSGEADDLLLLRQSPARRESPSPRELNYRVFTFPGSDTKGVLPSPRSALPSPSSLPASKRTLYRVVQEYPFIQKLRTQTAFIHIIDKLFNAIGRDQARNLIGPIEQEWMMQEAMNKEKEERAVAEKLRLEIEEWNNVKSELKLTYAPTVSFFGATSTKIEWAMRLRTFFDRCWAVSHKIENVSKDPDVYVHPEHDLLAPSNATTPLREMREAIFDLVSFWPACCLIPETSTSSNETTKQTDGEIVPPDQVSSTIGKPSGTQQISAEARAFQNERREITFSDFLVFAHLASQRLPIMSELV